MFDQVSKLPKEIPGVCLTSALKPEERDKIQKIIKEGRVKIIFMSPESLEGWEGGLMDGVEVGMVCIDEIHCVSEWSHNFRTAYIKLSYIIKHKMGVKLILGLTATATKKTIKSLIKEFEFVEVVKTECLNRENLILTTSRDKDKYRGVLDLLRSSRFVKLKSFIIYCTYIKTTINLSHYLTQSGYPSTAYNSSLPENSRLSIQTQFMTGNHNYYYFIIMIQIILFV